jgi:WD40 repeat protein
MRGEKSSHSVQVSPPPHVSAVEQDLVEKEVNVNGHASLSLLSPSLEREEEQEQIQVQVTGRYLHAHWVNDIELCCNERLLATCSSDATVKVWRENDIDQEQERERDQDEQKRLMHCWSAHQDYVYALDYADDVDRLVSVGFDGHVFMWDMERAAALTAADAVVEPFASAIGHKSSVYSVAVSNDASLLVTAGTERVVRVWDPRSGGAVGKQFKMRGHVDNVKALLVADDGRVCVSGSSDGTLRVWDIGMRRCIKTLALEDDSVFALATADRRSLRSVVAGTHRGRVFRTVVSGHDAPTLLCREPYPISSIAFDPLADDDGGGGGQSPLWIGTATSPSFNRWRQRRQHRSIGGGAEFRASDSTNEIEPGSSSSSPSSPKGRRTHELEIDVCVGGSDVAPLVRHRILNNRTQVLLLDAQKCATLWDVAKSATVRSFGQVDDFDALYDSLNPLVSTPSWFSCDTQTGSLAIHVDHPRCFSAPRYVVDMVDEERTRQLGLSAPRFSTPTPEVNLGQRFLAALFRHCIVERRHPPKASDDDSNDNDSSSSSQDSETTAKQRTLAEKRLRRREQREKAALEEEQERHRWNKMVEFDAGESCYVTLVDDHNSKRALRGAALKSWRSSPQVLPDWLAQCVLHSRVHNPNEKQKIKFSLLPLDASLPMLPHKEKRLHGTPLLTMSQLGDYVRVKLDGANSDDSDSGDKAHVASSSDADTESCSSSSDELVSLAAAAQPKFDIWCAAAAKAGNDDNDDSDACTRTSASKRSKSSSMVCIDHRTNLATLSLRFGRHCFVDGLKLFYARHGAE